MMSMIRATRQLFLALALVAAPAMAASPLDLLFETPHMAATPSGRTLAYGQTVSLPGSERDGTERRIELTVEPPADGQPVVDMRIEQDGNPAGAERFTGVPGNPILMVFLESVVRSVHEATGGSVFYLRNRIKEAMRAGFAQETRTENGAEAQVLILRPFEHDKNRDKLGPWADLSLEFALAETAPGMFVRLTATAGGAETPYVEEIALVPDN